MPDPRPPSEGHLIIVEPFVPEGQYERDVRAVGPIVGHEPTWVFEASEPLGWAGAVTSRLLLRPRSGTWNDRLRGKIVVNGCLDFADPTAEYCGLTAEYGPWPSDE